MFSDRPAQNPVFRSLGIAAMVMTLAACGVTAETQAQMDEYNRTIPVCDGAADCAAKWQAARDWVAANATFAIRTANDERIDTFRGDFSRAGTSVRVNRESLGGDRYRILVDVECIAANGCPSEWETMIDFNNVVGAARP